MAPLSSHSSNEVDFMAPGSGPRTLVGKHPISLAAIIGQTGMLNIVGISVKYKCTSFQSLAGAAVTQVRSV